MISLTQDKVVAQNTKLGDSVKSGKVELGIAKRAIKSFAFDQVSKALKLAAGKNALYHSANKESFAKQIGKEARTEFAAGAKKDE